MTATRRLAAILAADVVGYSRLMGEDKVGMVAIPRLHTPSLWARSVDTSCGLLKRRRERAG